MADSILCVEVMVRGYHIYRDIWTAFVNKELNCQREPVNTADPFVVAMVKEDGTVSHAIVPVLYM